MSTYRVKCGVRVAGVVVKTRPTEEAFSIVYYVSAHPASASKLSLKKFVFVYTIMSLKSELFGDNKVH